MGQCAGQGTCHKPTELVNPPRDIPRSQNKVRNYYAHQVLDLAAIRAQKDLAQVQGKFSATCGIFRGLLCMRSPKSRTARGGANCGEDWHEKDGICMSDASFPLIGSRAVHNARWCRAHNAYGHPTYFLIAALERVSVTTLTFYKKPINV